MNHGVRMTTPHGMRMKAICNGGRSSLTWRTIPTVIDSASAASAHNPMPVGGENRPRGGASTLLPGLAKMLAAKAVLHGLGSVAARATSPTSSPPRARPPARRRPRRPRDCHVFHR